ncbi:tyrosine-type recombinase/integrase [Jeotgalibaca porci]|uniref:tyrosine-type recombinase/integrase n=1 Tax=Jeotgalibaca porci TaxID=1868793 RepID=UPI0035A0C5AF
MSDNRKLINDLVVNVMTAFPETDEIALAVRIEEVVGNFNAEMKSADGIKEDLIDNIKLYISSKRLEGLSELTLEDYYRELMLFEFKVQKPTVRITTADIRQYLAGNDDVMASTNGKKLSVINSFFAWLVTEEILLRNPAARIKQMKQPKRLPKALTATELEILREACETLRERAMIEVMYSTGCRLSEISNMRRKDVDWVTASMSVIGKGNKERIVYLNHKAVFHLERYLEECEENENECAFLFSTERRPHRQMKGKTIQDLVDKISSRTNIKKNVTPHVFRHTFATLAMDNGIELGDLQQLLGHESPSTTLRYATVSEERKRNAHKRYVQ